jgi:DNA-binding CsgD family transcriptional regulator
MSQAVEHGTCKAFLGLRQAAAKVRLLGLGFWQAWWMLAMLTPLIMPTVNGAAAGLASPVLVTNGITTLAYLVVIALSRFFEPYLGKRAFRWLAPVLACAGTLGMGITARLAGTPVVVALFIVSLAILSIGNALLLMMWGELWSVLATARVGRLLSASYVFAFVLFFVISALPVVVGIACMVVLPAVSMLILGRARVREPRREATAVAFEAVGALPRVKVFGTLAVVSLIYGFSQTVPQTLTGAGGEAVWPGAFVFAGVCLLALACRVRLAATQADALVLFGPVMPALIIGLILLALPLVGGAAGLGPLCATAGEGLIVMAVYCLDMLIMLVSTDVAFRMRIPVVLTFGLSIFAARTGTFAGLALSALMLGGSTSAPTMGAWLLAGAIVVVLIAGAVFGKADLAYFYRPRAAAPAPAEPLVRSCERIATLCELTPREGEVLQLLAADRSIPYIAGELSIATGTAKHHVGNIYRKLGIGDRQSLHDVIEQGVPGKGAL